MIKMLNLLCAIPESFGWMLVGFALAHAVMLWVKIIKCFIQMWKENHEEEEEKEGEE